MTGTTSWIPALSLNSSVTDVLSESSGAISGVDANADKILFWDDSAGKTTYLTVGNNLTLSGTTLSADQQAFAITESSQVINTNYTLSSGKNGHSVGPVEIANNYTVTIPNNAVWQLVDMAYGKIKADALSTTTVAVILRFQHAGRQGSTR